MLDENAPDPYPDAIRTDDAEMIDDVGISITKGRKPRTKTAKALQEALAKLQK